MSAYVVDRDHITYLVEAATSRALHPNGGHLVWVWDTNHATGSYKRAELRCLDRPEMSRVAQMLWDECIRSVSHRYPEDTRATLPGPIDEDYIYGDHQHRHAALMDPIQVIKSCDCYWYQTCEHPEARASEAFAFIEALRASAWHSLSGYDEAAWGAGQLAPISEALSLHDLSKAEAKG